LKYHCNIAQLEKKKKKKKKHHCIAVFTCMPASGWQADLDLDRV